MNHPVLQENQLAHPAATPALSKPLMACNVMSAPALVTVRQIILILHAQALIQPNIPPLLQVPQPSVATPAINAPLLAPPVGHPAPVILPDLPAQVSPHRCNAIKIPLALPAINPTPAQLQPVLPPPPELTKLQPPPPPSVIPALMLVKPTGLPAL